MTKLIKSVNKTEEEENNALLNSNSITLSQKIQKESLQEDVVIQQNLLTQTVQTDKVKISSSSSVEEIANWLLSFIGNDVFEGLKNNPYLQLPYAEPDITLKGWLEKALKTIFPAEHIQKIGEQILLNQNTSGVAENVAKEKAALEERLNKANLRFEQMKNELENADDEKFRIKKELQNTLPLIKFIEEYYQDDANEHEEIRKIMNLLKETLDNKDDSIPVFVIRFSKGWTMLKNSVEIMKGEEKDKMEMVHTSLTALLKSISGLFLPERRPLLDIVAKFVSSKFQEYDFISPEQTLQIDPQIHNAGGLGSALIKEGITFAVIRKTSRQSVKYADIRV